MRWIKYSCLAMGLTTLVVVANLWFEIYPYASETQQLALNKMQRPIKLGEHNALPALYFFRYNVPPDQIEERFSVELALMRAAVNAGNLADFSAAMPTRLTKAFGNIKPEIVSPFFCKRGERCYAKVHANPQKFATALEPWQPILDKLSVLQKFDHVSLGILPIDPALAVSYFEGSDQAITAAALKAVQGDPAGAASDLCQFAQIWRQFGNTDSLITKMLSIAYLRRSTELLAELQSRFPESKIAESCPETFKPFELQDFDICPSLSNEWKLSADLMTNLESGTFDAANPPKWSAKILSKLSINVHHSHALFADTYASHCLTPSISAQYLAAEQKSMPKCSFFAYMGNPVGCWMATLALPDFSKYVKRIEDADNTLRLFQLAQFARSDEAQACSTDLSCAPKALIPAKFAINASARTVSIKLAFPQDDREVLTFNY